jgi:GST-like protein
MIDLYMWGTANGLRAAVALAECGLEHRIHKVDITKGQSRTPEFLKMNPAGAIPVMVDPEGPGGKPLTLSQSGAILVYACQKAGRFVPADARRREIASQWFMMAASDVAGTSAAVFRLENVVPEKSAANTDFFKNQLLGYFRVIDQQLAAREYLADEISYADLMLYPNYAARKPLIEAAGGMESLKRWGERMAARPGVKKGMTA